MPELVNGWLTDQGMGHAAAEIISRGIAVFAVIILSIIADMAARRFLLSGISFFVSRTGTDWDDILLKRSVFNKLSHLAPALVVYITSPLALKGYAALSAATTNAAIIYMVVIGIMILDSLFNATLDIYHTFEVSKDIPIKGFIQILKIVVYFLGAIFIISIMLDKSPLYLISGLGALTAVLILVFKDVILGFVAGIQLSANRMIAHGDWIEMPKYGADGDVLEVGLTTVKVQNWDKTITTIPTHALISESFKNWRGMSESGGRRIKRSVNIDMNSIKFCTDDMVDRFSRIRYISEYMEGKKREIAGEETTEGINDASPINRRRLTNIGTFRAYVIEYLKRHPMIRDDMTFIVRQLAPTEHGIPIEIYVFCKDKVWANYEAIQADIFDHILASVSEFDLRLFQNPTGGDFQKLQQGGK